MMKEKSIYYTYITKIHIKNYVLYTYIQSKYFNILTYMLD